jgi:hypothetical protein
MQVVCARVYIISWPDRLFSQTALSQPSQQGKEDLDKDICSNFGMMPSNRLRTGWVVVEVASPQEGERVTLAILVWPQT